jgi:hypothetical protein
MSTHNGQTFVVNTVKQAAVTLEQYLASLYPPGTPGELLAYVKEPFCRRFGRASNLGWFANEIRRLDGQGLDVYLTVNTLDGRAIRRRGQKTRGTESEVTAVVGLVADIDAAGKSGHDYPPQGRILQALHEMPLVPSIIVRSGRADGGLHVYWLLADPFIVRNDGDRQRIKSISERWQGLLKSKLQPYDLDSTFDLVRVLRPVGTVNHKYNVTVEALDFHPERRYSVEKIEGHLPRPEPVHPVAYVPPADVDAGRVIERARRYLAKLPPAVSGCGGHDATFHAACCLILGFGLSVDDAFAILAEWNATCDPPWSERELRHKLQSADQRTDERGYLLKDHQGLAGLPVVRRLVLNTEVMA